MGDDRTQATALAVLLARQLKESRNCSALDFGQLFRISCDLYVSLVSATRLNKNMNIAVVFTAVCYSFVVTRTSVRLPLRLWNIFCDCTSNHAVALLMLFVYARVQLEKYHFPREERENDLPSDDGGGGASWLSLVTESSSFSGLKMKEGLWVVLRFRFCEEFGLLGSFPE